jgi:hypothetical protein
MNGIIAYESPRPTIGTRRPARDRNAYYQNNERLPQYQAEMVMRKRMAGLPAVTSRFGFVATRSKG